jgi:hypothetical protein
VSSDQYRVQVVPKSGRQNPDVLVRDAGDHIIHTDTGNLRKAGERLKVARRLAKKFGGGEEEAARKLDDAWNEVENRREEAEALAGGALPVSVSYHANDGFLVCVRPTQHGPVEVALTNFDARIVGQTTLDDGAEKRTVLQVEGTLCGGRALPRVEVPAELFAGMRWVLSSWGTQACVNAGMGIADHVRVALQRLSGDVPTRTVYAHAGWREIDGQWCYLHAAGAVGPDGAVAGVEVSLPDALGGYRLPGPPEGSDLATAVRASLAVLDCAPDRITAPVLGAAYRAVLGPADYSIHLSGPTGAGKTELAALAQQHWGAGLDARHLPGSWASTGNSLEGLAFAAADALLCVDDFAPTGSTTDVARVHREADRLLRAQGNRSGRMRCRPDGTLRPARMPRGTILSTGEDVPRGQSLRARALVLELAPGDVDWGRVSACQRDAAANVYALAMAGYVRHLAADYHDIRQGLAAATAHPRERILAEGLHARTPGIIADLAAGWQHWLDFAAEVGAIDGDTRGVLARRVWVALLEVAGSQGEHLQAAEP